MSSPFPPSLFFCSPKSALHEDGLLALGGVLHPFVIIDAIIHGVFPWTFYGEFEAFDATAIHTVAPLTAQSPARPTLASNNLSASENRAYETLAAIANRALDASERLFQNTPRQELTTSILHSLPEKYQTATWNGVGYHDLPNLKENGEILAWYSPCPRAILELPALHIPRRMQRLMRSGKFEITFDMAFPEVMLGCASAEDRLETGCWITREFYAAYCQLHELGVAHSAECWRVERASGERRLVGGVYGLALNGFFDGESMFSVESNASKIALFTLAQHLQSQNFSLFDLQVLNDHTSSLGGIEIPREEYLQRLEAALLTPTSF